MVFQVRQRKGRWPSDQSIDLEAPFAKPVRQVPLVAFVIGRLPVDGEHLRNLVAAELASERMTGHQESLGSIGQRFAHAVEAAMIRWNETVAVGEAGGDAQAGDA